MGISYSFEASAQTDRSSRKQNPGNQDLVNLQLLGLTDLHGYLQAFNDAANGKIDTPDGLVTVGGAAYLTTHLNQLEKEHENSIRISVGDNFMGWPFEVYAHRNEPTVEFLNTINVELSAAGNHEFDWSKKFLTNHMIKGKCFGRPDEDSCFIDSSGRRFQGAKFEYLASNVIEEKTGKLLLKPYVIKQFSDGKGGTIPVGFIGLTEVAAMIKSFSFQEGVLTMDPLKIAADHYAKELQNKGVETIIAVVHEGGEAGTDFNGCSNPQGMVFDFAKEATPAIDAVLAGHWHTSFNCVVDDPVGNPRPVIEGSFHGKLINEVNLWIDPESRDVVRDKTTSTNHLVTRDVPADAKINNMVSYWKKRGDEKYSQPVAKLKGDITRIRNENGESTLADLIADAHYAAGKKMKNPADFALVPPGALRGGDLLYAKSKEVNDQDGRILFGEQWKAHEYVNPILVVTLTGKQIKQVLEEQWRLNTDGTTSFYPLAVSHNVRYSYTNKKPIGERVNTYDIVINNKVLNPKKSYRVAALASLVVGTDGYPSFKNYRNPIRIKEENGSWAFLKYLKDKKVLDVPELVRVSKIE
ncbi:bifunctional metallophosphatase/5'-nucleotidase [Fictibacillus terranigra]|uniref:Bifunctional UDP-sugar hydrolase/5'-nucleotidase n=1 Tax=Fictibacillus terranigra TaxID=3058424 RepID=A0ABT8EDJ8_9BACL|nr:bifunctional UDP-sugar hydrolase/5'-nucleotidase [Fictibacillus sp. CENA-BCM004]MDN4076001.1 bifunctional UDP-sugar hydrolase/5'-nucleotidase [Fictibacillus sp. CENA-BCM004]